MQSSTDTKQKLKSCLSFSECYYSSFSGPSSLEASLSPSNFKSNISMITTIKIIFHGCSHPPPSISSTSMKHSIGMSGFSMDSSWYCKWSEEQEWECLLLNLQSLPCGIA